MNNFRTWLTNNPGMAQKLCERLGINKTNISNVKAARRPMPQWWMPTVVDLSLGKLNFEGLVMEQVGRKTLRGNPPSMKSKNKNPRTNK